ncbi:unnamed protein product [Rotaria socialis]|nr:unnamed protein product [Rotaria socialis]CAF3514888.1 unnamed protein product [Rotaria socialis]CAF4227568.1 unnamed protein product [Rotaria socialis]CAF4439256.1 unnamed protein product [Rotaria socialis]
MELHRLTVITNDFHMTQTTLIFDWIFSLSTSAIDRCEKCSIEYFTVSNQDMTDEQLVARIDKAHSACEDVKTKIQKIKKFSQMAQFLFIEHGAYKVEFLHSRRSQLDSLTASTY